MRLICLFFFIFKLGKSEKDLISRKIYKDELWTIPFFPAKPTEPFRLSAYPLTAISPDPATEQHNRSVSFLWKPVPPPLMILPRLTSPRSLLLPNMLDSFGTCISRDVLDTISFLKLPPSSYIHQLNTSETYMLEQVAFTLPSKPTVMSDSSPSFALPFRPGPESPIPASGATIPFSDLS